MTATTNSEACQFKIGLINTEMNELLNLELDEMSVTINESSINHAIQSKVDSIEHDIDIRIESIIIELNKFRDLLKQNLKVYVEKLQSQDVFSSLHELVQRLTTQNEINQALLSKKQNALSDCQDALAKFRNQLNEIRFIPGGEALVDSQMLGKITKPFVYCTRIKNTHDVRLDAKQLRRAIMLSDQNKLVLTDWDDGSLKLINLGSNYMETFRHAEIKRPWGICTDHQHNLYVSEHMNGMQILVFNSKLEFQRKFDISLVIDLASIIIDQTNVAQAQLMYISQWNQNKITIYETNTGKYVNSISVNSPSFTRFNQKYMCTVSFTDYTRQGDSKLSEITNGSNCVFLIDKASHQILHTIKFNTWLQPYGLMIDRNSNIFTTSFELNEKNQISHSRFLTVFNEQGSLLQKIKLDAVNNDSDTYYTMHMYDNQLAVVFSNIIKFIEFE